MQNAEILYKSYVLIPMAAYDEGLYASMLIVKKPDGVQRATGVLGLFPCPVDARRFALSYGMAEIDQRRLPEPEWTRPDALSRSPMEESQKAA